MVIFKCLSLKALSALQDHEGGGGDGVTKIITQMFLSITHFSMKFCHTQKIVTQISTEFWVFVAAICLQVLNFSLPRRISAPIIVPAEVTRGQVTG